MVNLTDILVKSKRFWTDCKDTAIGYLDANHFRCLVLIEICGGIKFSNGNRWMRSCMLLYRLLGFYQFCMALFKAYFNIRYETATITLYTSCLIVIAFVVSFVRMYQIRHYSVAIEQCKAFIVDQSNSSGDPSFDQSVRKRSALVTRNSVLILFTYLCGDQLLIWIPNAARDRLFGIPEQFKEVGHELSFVMQQMFVGTLAVFWDCRIFYSTLVMDTLLMGLKSEFEIMLHAFETIPGRMMVNQGQNHITYFKGMLNRTLAQHIKLCR